MNPEIRKLCDAVNAFNAYHKTTIPLCAAENVMSDFTKLPLSSGFQERYIMGSAYEYTMEDNFIGSEMLLPFYKHISELGDELFHAKYTDARTLTGMNAANLLVAALVSPNDNIMILGKQWGGHASMAPTFERLGANLFEAPYNLDNYDFDYDALNREIKDKNIKFLSVAPSDILFPHDFSRIDDRDCVILFDYSHLLGLIAAGLLENPLDSMKNAVLFGGTHKTMPGPAHGLMMTNNDRIYAKLDKEINPKYLRNVQTHQVISLLFTLVEMKYFGAPYQTNIVRIGNLLGAELEKLGFNMVKKGDIYTQTHQLFLEMSKEQMEIMFRNAAAEHITLNTKKKPLFRGGFGIRLGQQEIARYNWSDDSICAIAEALSLIAKQEYDKFEVKNIIASLPPKIVHFTFDKSEYEMLDL
jgi:glycine/serine hydroxymethyltransferase